MDKKNEVNTGFLEDNIFMPIFQIGATCLLSLKKKKKEQNKME